MFSPTFGILESSRRGSAETNLTGIQEGTGLIPGLSQWVKDLALPWAVVQVADVAWIMHCCGSGIGLQPQLQQDPWELTYAAGMALKRPKKKKKKKEKNPKNPSNLCDTCMFLWLAFVPSPPVSYGRGGEKYKSNAYSVIGNLMIQEREIDQDLNHISASNILCGCKLIIYKYIMFIAWWIILIKLKYVHSIHLARYLAYNRW